jgi:hypothetical protein
MMEQHTCQTIIPLNLAKARQLLGLVTIHLISASTQYQ